MASLSLSFLFREKSVEMITYPIRLLRRVIRKEPRGNTWCSLPCRKHHCTLIPTVLVI